MSIGNFKDPDQKDAEPIQDKREGQPTPAARMVEGIQSNIETNVSNREASAEKADDWRERLKKENISHEKAHAIIDDLLTKGFYEETYNITSRVTVTFRSRTQYDYQRYMRALDIVNPRFNDEAQEVAMRYFVAASVVRCNTTTFQHPEVTATKREIDEAFEKRLDWVEKQPDHLILLLSHKLRAFDQMLATVFSEGVIENF